MDTNRRRFLATAAAGSAFASTPLCLAAQPAAVATPLLPLFDALVAAQLHRNPEGATQLGLDRGANADLRARLSDQSAAGILGNKAAARSELARLETVDRAALTPEQQIDLDCVLFTRRSAVAVGGFDYGGASYGPSPYVV